MFSRNKTKAAVQMEKEKKKNTTPHCPLIATLSNIEYPLLCAMGGHPLNHFHMTLWRHTFCVNPLHCPCEWMKM